MGVGGATRQIWDQVFCGFSLWVPYGRNNANHLGASMFDPIVSIHVSHTETCVILRQVPISSPSSGLPQPHTQHGS